MSNRLTRIFISVLLVVTFLLPNSIVFAANLQSNETLIKDIEIGFKGGTGFNYYYWNFDFDDKFFSKSSYVYDHDLAKMSLGMALSGGVPPATSIYWGEASMDARRNASIERTYEITGFENVKYYMYDRSLNETHIKSPLSMAQKRIEVDGEFFDLVTVVLMGHGYGSEWESNFTLDSNSSVHKGFSDSAKKAREHIIDYLQNVYVSSGNEIKLWLVGFSRGSNIANILAADIDKEIEEGSYLGGLITRENFYTYTFGCANTVMIENNPDFNEDTVGIFNNIFNIRNPADVFTVMPPSQWGFRKYGVDMVLQVEETDNYSPNYDLITSIYEKMTGDVYNVRELQNHHLLAGELEAFFDMFASDVPYYQENIMNFAIAISVLANTGVPIEDEPGKWLTGNFKESFLYIYKKEGQRAYLRSDVYLTLMLFAINPKLSLIRFLSKDIYSTIVTVLAFIDINEIHLNISGYELISFLADILTRYDMLYFVNFGQGHYPNTYISWMFSSDDPSTLFVTP